MRLIQSGLVFLAAYFFSFQIPLEAELNPIKLSFDGREWVLGYQNQEDQGIINEFVLKGESVENWSELMTVQSFWGDRYKDVTPAIFYDKFVKLLKNQVPGVQVKLIEQDPNSVIFEWWMQGNDPQHEWVRVLKDTNGYYVLHYATKKLDQVSKQGPIWTKLLKEARVVPEALTDSKSNDQQTQTSGTTFEDPQGKFTIMIPAGWESTMLKDDQQNPWHIFIHPQKEANVVIGTSWPIDQDLEQRVLDAKRPIEEKGAQVISQIKIERSNQEPATGVVMGPTTLDSGRKVNWFLVIVPGKDRVQPFLFSAETDKFDQYLPMFKEMVRSYTFTKSGKDQVQDIKYEDPKKTFSFTIPSNWEEKKLINASGNAYAQFFLQEDNEASLLLPTYDRWPAGKESEEYFKEFQKSMIGEGAKVLQSIKIDRANLSPGIGNVIEYKKPDTGEDRYMLFVLVQGPKNAQPFAFSANVEFFEQYLPVFKSIVRSYKFAGEK